MQKHTFSPPALNPTAPVFYIAFAFKEKKTLYLRSEDNARTWRFVLLGWRFV